MLISRITSKNMKTGILECGYNIIFNNAKHNVKFRNIFSLNSNNEIMRTSVTKHFLVRKRYSAGKSSSHGCSSMECAVFPNKENERPIRSNFQDMMHVRKIQAHRSVLITLADKIDIPFALTCFEKYGSIANIYLSPRKSENCFLLVEFSSETSVQNLLLNCGFQTIDNVYPISSRIIKYENKSKNVPANQNMNIKEESDSELTFKTGVNISEFIEKVYSNEKPTELDIRLRFFLCSLMKDSISGLFPHCDALPFGSSVTGVGKRGCDLDVVLRLYPDKMNGDGEFYFLNKTSHGKSQKNFQQRALSHLEGYFHFSPGMSTSERIMFARVPILKMKHTILNIDIDVSVNNISAVLMSDMLYFCGEIDSRVRPLVHIVKRWAKETNVTLDKPGQQISNFGLTNLVLFFLQTRASPSILPPLNDACAIRGSDNSYDFRLQYLKSLEEFRNDASLNKQSLALLLKEFFAFLSSYPFHEKIISLLSGEARERDKYGENPLYVEYPLDEAMNMTKNVSKAEYDAMREKATLSVKYLENNFNQNVKSEKDFSALLGVPSVSRIGIKSMKFNVSSVLENEKNFRNKNTRYKMM